MRVWLLVAGWLGAAFCEGERWSKAASGVRRQSDWVPLAAPCPSCRPAADQSSQGTQSLPSELTPPLRPFDQTSSAAFALPFQQTRFQQDTPRFQEQATVRFQEPGAPRYLQQTQSPHKLSQTQNTQLSQQQNSQFRDQQGNISPHLLQVSPQQFAQANNQLFNQQFLTSQQLLPPPFIPQRVVFPQPLNPSQVPLRQNFPNDAPEYQLPFNAPSPSFLQQAPLPPQSNAQEQPQLSHQQNEFKGQSSQSSYSIPISSQANNRSNYNHEESEKEKEEVQLLYVPVETLRQHGRNTERPKPIDNLAKNNYDQIKETTPTIPVQATQQTFTQQNSNPIQNQQVSQNSQFRHPIQSYKNQVPAAPETQFLHQQFISQQLRPTQTDHVYHEKKVNKNIDSGTSFEQSPVKKQRYHKENSEPAQVHKQQSQIDDFITQPQLQQTVQPNQNQELSKLHLGAYDEQTPLQSQHSIPQEVIHKQITPVDQYQTNYQQPLSQVHQGDQLPLYQQDHSPHHQQAQVPLTKHHLQFQQPPQHQTQHDQLLQHQTTQQEVAQQLPQQQLHHVYHEERVHTSSLPPPHQPPLSVYMESSDHTKVADVLALLKGAKTIPVLDTIGSDSPQVFVGPSNLSPPLGYAKFELPYLSSLEGNRVERKVDQLPFFVAPLNFQPPPGYAKIPFPAPHIGSVVVSNRTALKTPLHDKTVQVSSTSAPDIDLVTQRETYTNAYTIPVEISPISPQLPSLVNSLQDGLGHSSTITEVPTTTPVPTTPYRRQPWRGSQRGYTTSEPTSPTRRPLRQRRPYNGRPYKQPVSTERPTTTHSTFPASSLEHTEVTESTVPIQQATEEQIRNHDNHFSNQRNQQPTTNNQFQTHDQNTQFIPQNQDYQFVQQNQNFEQPLKQANQNNQYFTSTEESNLEKQFQANYDQTPANVNDEHSSEKTPFTSYSGQDTSTQDVQNVNNFHQNNAPKHDTTPRQQRLRSRGQTRLNLQTTENVQPPQLTEFNQPPHTNPIVNQNFQPEVPYFQTETTQPELPKPSQHYNTQHVISSTENTQILPQEINAQLSNTQGTPSKSIEAHFNLGSNNDASQYYNQQQQDVQYQAHPQQPQQTPHDNLDQSQHQQHSLQGVSSPFGYNQEQTTEYYQTYSSLPTAELQNTQTTESTSNNHHLTTEISPDNQSRYTKYNRLRGKVNLAPEINTGRNQHDAADSDKTYIVNDQTHHSEESSVTEADKTTANPVAVRVRGRVRGRQRGQTRNPYSTTTTEAPNYPINTEFDKGSHHNEYSNYKASRQPHHYRKSPTAVSANTDSTYSEPTKAPEYSSQDSDQYYTKPSRKYNSYRQSVRRPVRPLDNDQLTSSTTSSPTTRYLVRTRKPPVQTKLTTGRHRIRRPTTSTTTTTTTTEHYSQPDWVGNAQSVNSFAPSAASNEVLEPYYNKDAVQNDYNSYNGHEKPRSKPKHQTSVPPAASDPSDYWNQAVTIQQSESFDYSPESSPVTQSSPTTSQFQLRSEAQPVSEPSWSNQDQYEQDYFNSYQQSPSGLVASPTTPIDQTPFPSNEQQITYTGLKNQQYDGKTNQWREKESATIGGEEVISAGLEGRTHDVPNRRRGNKIPVKLPEVNADESEAISGLPLSDTEKGLQPNGNDRERDDIAHASKEDEVLKSEHSFEVKDVSLAQETEEKPIDPVTGKKVVSAGRRRGAWVRVRVRRPQDMFETAESQNLATVSGNAIPAAGKHVAAEAAPHDKTSWEAPPNHRPELEVTSPVAVEATTERLSQDAGISFEQSLTDMLKSYIKAEEGVDSTSTTQKQQNYTVTEPPLTEPSTTKVSSEISTTSAYVTDLPDELTDEPTTMTVPFEDADLETTSEAMATTLEDNKGSGTNAPRVLGTSTTTEISLETEICYRGRCVKSKKRKAFDLLPVE